MVEQPMETTFRTVLWRQFGAAIDMLENALVACPTPLWKERLWSAPSDHSLMPEFAEFWYLAYHAIFWLDLYLSGSREDEFAPPAPFTRAELDPAGVLPERPYTKEELHAYLAATRRKCHAQLSALTDERARQAVEYPWAEGQAVSFLELQLYNMRHVQEHAAQLSLFLGQHAIPDEALDWVRERRMKRASEFAEAPVSYPSSRLCIPKHASSRREQKWLAFGRIRRRKPPGRDATLAQQRSLGCQPGAR